MSATDTFHATSEFVLRLRSLRQQRRKDKRRVTREPLSGGERLEILKKTAYRCHICGGKIDGKWEADHVFSHALGGEHALENYLPAHQICNGYRWFYGDEEFQWILKLGVWLRTQIENETAVGRIAAAAFCAHERARVARCKETDAD